MSNPDLELCQQELMKAQMRLQKNKQILEMALNVIAEQGGQLLNWTSELKDSLPDGKISEMTFKAGGLHALMFLLEERSGLNIGSSSIKRRRRVIGLDETLDIDVTNLEPFFAEPKK